MRRALGSLLFVASLPACAVARQATMTPMDTTACGAVAAAIDSLVIGRDGGRVGLVEETLPRHALAVPEPAAELVQMPGIDSSTMRSFREHNGQVERTCATLPLVGGMTMLTRRDIDSLPTGGRLDDYWAAFHARFPGVAGITRVSGVGVGMGGRQALLTIDHSCGGLCGAGHVVLLERDDQGTWRVKRAAMTWIS